MGPKSGSEKAITLGTHRSLPPEQTWQLVQQAFPSAGISRVGLLTGLDTVGIPIAFAVRPGATTLVTSSGKGITPLLARISAAMESVELHCAEAAITTGDIATANDLAPLGYEVALLAQHPRSLFDERLPLRWLPANRMRSGVVTYVPTLAVAMSSAAGREWDPSLFSVSSNGLASGNSREEAALHALLELIERDAIYHFLDGRPAAVLDLDTASGVVAALVDQFRAAQCDVRLVLLDSVPGLYVMQANVKSPDLPIQCTGAGAHLDPQVAASRALTEAAQNRLVLIAGSRDDIPPDLFQHMTATRGKLIAPEPRQEVVPVPTHSWASATIDEDLHHAVTQVSEVTGVDPVLVDLTSDGLQVCVVKVLAPGLAYRKYAVTRARSEANSR